MTSNRVIRLSHRVLAVIGSAILFAASTIAQAPATPDLSGTWKLNPAKSKVAKKTTLDPETLVINCAGASIEIAISSNGKQSLAMFIADGKEHLVKDVPGSGQIYNRAEWKKSVLVTALGARVNSPGLGDTIAEHEQRWSLSPEGRVLAREFDNPKQTFVYDKQ
jgi:membrane-bound inhibitor of C-type lysozyme